MRLVGALVLGEADITSNAEHRLLRLSRQRQFSGGREREQVGDEGDHRAADVRLIVFASRFELGGVVVVRKLAQEAQALGGKAGEVHRSGFSWFGSGSSTRAWTGHVRYGLHSAP